MPEPRLLDEEFTRPDADDLADALKAVADPARLQILNLLAVHGELTTVALVDHIGRLSQPTVTHHLGILRRAGLVSTREVGVWRPYRLNRSALTRLRGLLGVTR